MTPQLIAAFRRQRAATVARFQVLTPAQWEREWVLGRTVADIAAHLLGVDAAAIGKGRGPALRTSRGLYALSEWGAVPSVPVELLAAPAALTAAGESLARGAAAIPRVFARLPHGHALGREPARVMLARRMLDEWVHTHDIALATGAVPPDLEAQIGRVLGVAVLDMSQTTFLPRLAISAGVIRLVLDPGGAVKSDPSGPVPAERLVWTVDAARRQYGRRVGAQPDAVVRMTFALFVLVAQARMTWPTAPPGQLVVEGEVGLAHQFLDALSPPPEYRPR